MPNVLIEAQLAGVPVITTPAGGAPEAVLEGRTGHVLSSAESPDVDEAVALLTALIRMGPAGRGAMGAAARQWAQKSFSIEPMLRKTVDVFLAPDDAPLLP
jgi:glycosyltransferase involved in cell wall biosynthesis